MSKFYAVRAGHNPGIYDTWEECQKQISGFRGSQCTLSLHLSHRLAILT
jgi:viroplasmin and RNaseH domain-containing protein